MTTTNQDDQDEELQSSFQTNMFKQHIYAPLAHFVMPRVAHSTGGMGAEMENVLNNKQSPSELLVDLICQQNESILVGSIEIHAIGKVAHEETATWQTSSTSGAHYVQSGTRKEATVIQVPPFFLNHQFKTVDIEIDGKSMNSHLKNASASQGGHGAVAVANTLLNTPRYTLGYTHMYTDQLTSESPGVVVDSHDQNWEALETLYHQINQTVNTFNTLDTRKEDMLMSFPRGMSMRLRLYTNGGLNDRGLIKVDNTSKKFTAEFVTARIIYKVIVIPEENLEFEKTMARMATVDIGLQQLPLAKGQTSAVIQLSRSRDEFIPHGLVLLVGRLDTFHPPNITYSTGIRPVGRVTKVSVLFSGKKDPDFMKIYPDFELATNNLIKRQTMVTAWSGSLGSKFNSSQPLSVSHIEHLLQKNVQLYKHVALIRTDVTNQLHRDASSGVQAGHLDLLVTLAEVDDNEMLWVIRLSKYDIQFIRSQSTNGAVWSIDSDNTKPAFSQAEAGGSEPMYM